MGGICVEAVARHQAGLGERMQRVEAHHPEGHYRRVAALRDVGHRVANEAGRADVVAGRVHRRQAQPANDGFRSSRGEVAGTGVHVTLSCETAALKVRERFVVREN